MKDQNTSTNTLDSEWLEEIIQCVYNNGKMSEWKRSETNSSDIFPWLMNEQAIAKIKEHIEALVAQAVNKAKEERFRMNYKDDRGFIETALDNVLSVGTKYEGDSEAKKPVKDTQINTPDPIEMLYIESPSITLKQFREAISKEVSQAVNKARLSELDWALSRLNTFGRETDTGALNRAINEIDDNIALVVEELTKTNTHTRGRR